MSKTVAFSLERCASDQCIFRLTSLDGINIGLTKGILGMTFSLSVTSSEIERGSPSAVLSHEEPGTAVLIYFTGCEHSRELSKCALKVTQTAYIGRLVGKFDVMTTSPTPALMPITQTQNRRKNSPKDHTRSGVLRIAHDTRPDISNEIREITRHAHASNPQHWQAVVRTKYLKGTRGKGGS